MVPFLIRLPEEDYRLYKEIARERGISLAEYFRSSAKNDRMVTKKKKSKYSFWDLGTKIVFHGKGPKDGSINHDKYYYEFKEAKLRKFYKESLKQKKQ